MISREAAIRRLEHDGFAEAAAHVERWRNAQKQTGGWDANLKSQHPDAAALLWPRSTSPRRRAPAGATGARSIAPVLTEDLPRRSAGGSAFDDYWMVDWSASKKPRTGPDSVWCAHAEWGDDGRLIVHEPVNHPTRHALVESLRSELQAASPDRRMLVGFDFPFGYPRGLAAALGLVDAPPWEAVWRLLHDRIEDDEQNVNNRFEVAARLNEDLCAGFGPFYGRPTSLPTEQQRTLSTKRTHPLSFVRRGVELAFTRKTDGLAGAKSSPWFLYGGSNSVGSQALLGIPRVWRLHNELSGSQIWPFQTGATLPSRAQARIVFAEVYPSQFHRRVPGSEVVHDAAQVSATAIGLARHDAGGTLTKLFEAPGGSLAAVTEEGWILGCLLAP